MKLVDYNNSSSLVIDNIEKAGNRINFTITALLYDERTDTNIRFETNSYVIIDDWQQKSEMLLIKHALELENFSFHAVLDQRYYWDTNKISNQNFFELSSCLNNSRLKFVIESDEIFGRFFFDEVSNAIQYQSDICNNVSAPCVKDGLIHVALRLTKAYIDGRCDLQLKVYSDTFHIVRAYDGWIEEEKITSEHIHQFNVGKLEEFTTGGEFWEIVFNWTDGKKRGTGSINDFTWPGPNELVFKDCVDIEMENINWDDLPLSPVKVIPASEFKVYHP